MKFHRICVLGGSGFVGSAIVQMLAAQGCQVRVLSRNRERAKDLTVLPTVEVVSANIHDQDELVRQFAGMDAIINLVGVLHEAHPAGGGKAALQKGDYHENHIELVNKLIVACAANGIQRLLHMSALGADPDSQSAYQRSKGLGEALARAAGMAAGVSKAEDAHQFVYGGSIYVTIFRPSVIFGRGDSFLTMFANLVKFLPVIPLANPGARFQPVWVEDVAGAFADALDSPATFGATYNLCGPTIYTLQALVKLVANTLGRHPRIIPLSRRLSYLQAWMMEWMPGKKLMTRDNYYAMLVDNICTSQFPAPPGIKVTGLEAIAAEYLTDVSTPRGRYTAFRGRAGR